MRNLFLTLVLVCTGTYLFAQKETPATAKFQSFYNNEKYDSIFYMFDKNLQTVLPLDKAIGFFSAQKSKTGIIIKTEFIAAQTYKLTYNHATQILDFGVDDNNKVNLLFLKPLEEKIGPEMERNATKMKLPFKGEWTVVWGGDTKEQNYHVASNAQKNAFDILIKDGNDKSYKTNGQRNEDYYAFGQELTAPCDGEIVMAVDGIKDNKPGLMNPMYALGNSVIIKTEKNEFLYFAHFKQFSVKVKEGQKIKQGQLLGLCGNSGNSSEPHIHFHIQNIENVNTGTGVKCYFDQLIVNGQAKTDYSPVQKDKIKN